MPNYHAFKSFIFCQIALQSRYIPLDFPPDILIRVAVLPTSLLTQYFITLFFFEGLIGVKRSLIEGKLTDKTIFHE